MIGQYIAHQRRVAGLTQEAFGDALGLSQSQISRIEKNENPLTTSLLLRMASLLGFDPADALRADAPARGGCVDAAQ